MTQPLSEYDLVVVGGGPAGCTLATLVAKRGHKVLLLERETKAGFKIGESLLPATVNGVCALLGVQHELQAAGFLKKYGGTLRWGRDEEPWSFQFSPSGPAGADPTYAYQVERIKFDEILLQNSARHGVHLLRGHSAVEPIIEEGRSTGVHYLDDRGTPHTVSAKFVADASGQKTLFSRFVGTKTYSKFFKNIVLFGYYENGKRLPPPMDGNALSIAFSDGWFWYIPLSPTMTSVGLVLPASSAKLLNGDRDALLAEMIRRCPLANDYLKDAVRIQTGIYGTLRVMRDYSYTHSAFWKPGLMLLGDAACFADPLLSQGVHLATYAGLLAARSVNGCLEGDVDETTSFGEYERRYRREFGLFYEYLIYLYDMNHNQDSYYWKARSLLKTEERANDAFVALVAGLSASDPSLGTGNEFFRKREGIGDIFQAAVSGEDTSAQNQTFDIDAVFGSIFLESDQLQKLVRQGHLQAAQPMFDNGLVPSIDGLKWVTPAVQAS